jgi:hypothetical protein
MPPRELILRRLSGAEGLLGPKNLAFPVEMAEYTGPEGTLFRDLRDCPTF